MYSGHLVLILISNKADSFYVSSIVSYLEYLNCYEGRGK